MTASNCGSAASASLGPGRVLAIGYVRLRCKGNDIGTKRHWVVPNVKNPNEGVEDRARRSVHARLHPHSRSVDEG